MRKNLLDAKTNKCDEFYTLMEDIENELKHYKEHFEGKTVYCNCDDPNWSNFWIYFHQNFTSLKLKKLISTHCNLDGSSSYATIYEGGNDSDYKDWERINLKGNGDFASDECIQFLKEADIVVTNPAFSSFRSFLSLLVKYDKKFIVWANNNCITYKEVFPLIKENKMWLGYASNAICHFRVPNTYDNYDKEYTKEKNDGNRYAKVFSISTFTNLDILKRHDSFIGRLNNSYYKNPNLYIKLDNYDAINVDKVKRIPNDYFGVMAVPITFLGKYNPEEFEILGKSGDIEWATHECTFFTPPDLKTQKEYWKQDNSWRVQNPYLVENGVVKHLYCRLFIKRIPIGKGQSI